MGNLGEQLRVESCLALFERRLEKQIKKGKPKSKIIFTQTMIDYLKSILKAKEESRPLAMISILFPPEILLSMDIPVFAFEQYTIQMLSFGLGYEFMDRGEAYGFSKEACSPHKACIGLAVEGIFPRPDLLLYTGQIPCDSSAIMAENIEHIYNCPSFWLNLPFDEDEEALKHLVAGLEDMILFIEKHTGAKFNEDKLKEFLERDIIIQDYFAKTQALRGATPTVMGAKDAFANFGIRMCSEGLPAVVDFMQAQYEECWEKIEKGIGVVPEERHRVVLCGVYPFWNMGILDWMEEEFGAVTVVDFFNALVGIISNLNRDEISHNPLETYARKILSVYPCLARLGGPSYLFAEDLANTAAKLRCDSSVFFAHFGCKQTCGFNRIVTDAIMEKANIPSVIVDIDACDPKIMSEEQIKDQIRNYFQVLETQVK
jgi:benzoyl-CoA reductase/2-hydroxyglutaryl-CoA dehydratase subunit BcrC/BadD/HgdB